MCIFFINKCKIMGFVFHQLGFKNDFCFWVQKINVLLSHHMTMNKMCFGLVFNAEFFFFLKFLLKCYIFIFGDQC